jgi:acetylornithine deacetylase/succinyl-diaminopimelate desuccinylase-like protein
MRRNARQETSMLQTLIVLMSALVLTSTATAAESKSRAGEPAFRELYKELVETNTALSNGSCTLAAERMAARLKSAGLEQVQVFTAPGHPKEGGLFAVYPGSDARAKAMLLLAHIDVVEAKREDWTRDPFVLVEENGSFYARGAVDDKAQAAIWVDTLIRYAHEKFKPRRTIKIALTCGEETAGAFNGAQWLATNHRDWIDAEFAINEGAWGEMDAQGRKLVMNVQAGEKAAQNYRLEATNAGGHSSRPRKDNAIYQLASALSRVEAYEFPAQFTDASRAYFSGMAKIQAAKGNADVATAMNAMVRDPNDASAIALVSSKDVSWNATLRTTCVATMLDGGHATNALPQRARANVNCRVFPGVSEESVRVQLEKLVANPEVKVTMMETRAVASPPPPLSPKIMGPFEKLSAQYFPGVPVLPILQAGATDGVYLNGVGIPTYGMLPIFVGPDLGGIHGLNEYINVQSLMDARAMLYDLVKVYSTQK